MVDSLSRDPTRPRSINLAKNKIIALHWFFMLNLAIVSLQKAKGAKTLTLKAAVWGWFEVEEKE